MSTKMMSNYIPRDDFSLLGEKYSMKNIYRNHTSYTKKFWKIKLKVYRNLPYPFITERDRLYCFSFGRLKIDLDVTGFCSCGISIYDGKTQNGLFLEHNSNDNGKIGIWITENIGYEIPSFSYLFRKKRQRDNWREL